MGLAPTVRAENVSRCPWRREWAGPGPPHPAPSIPNLPPGPPSAWAGLSARWRGSLGAGTWLGRETASTVEDRDHSSSSLLAPGHLELCTMLADCARPHFSPARGWHAHGAFPWHHPAAHVSSWGGVCRVTRAHERHCGKQQGTPPGSPGGRQLPLHIHYMPQLVRARKLGCLGPGASQACLQGPASLTRVARGHREEVGPMSMSTQSGPIPQRTSL